MGIVDEMTEAGGASPPATVKVWDPLVRVFHWAVSALFGLAFVTGDEVEGLHIAAGYAILALVALRILWGFVGTRYARFTSFVRHPRVVLAHLRDAALLRAPRHLGHNPAGGAMVITLLALLTVTGITGHMMTTDAYWGAKWIEETHEAFANVTLAFVVLHILGVLFACFEHRENLVKAMLSGRKRAE